MQEVYFELFQMRITEWMNQNFNERRHKSFEKDKICCQSVWEKKWWNQMDK